MNDEAEKLDYDEEDLAALARLLENDPGVVSFVAEDGTGPLDWAVGEWIDTDPSSGAADEMLAAAVLQAMVMLLLAHGADPNAGADPPLFRVHTPQQAELLIDHGADVNARNALGSSPLMNAIHEPDLYDYLTRRGADPHQANLRGESAASRLERLRHAPS